MALTDVPFAEMLREVEEVVGPDGLQGVQFVEPWPFGRGPAGPLRLSDGPLAHGAYARTTRDGVELLVANNGWPIEHTRCPGPMPPPLSACGPSNYWISAHGSLVEHDDGLRIIDPGDAVLARVAAKAKPLGLADTDRPEQARAWKEAAVAHGLACSVDEAGFTDRDSSEVWFVSAARRERLAELVDLRGLSAWYHRALDVAGLSHRVTATETALEGLAERSPSDFIDRTDELIMVPMLDDEPDAITSPVAGLLLGYWPPTTVAFMAHHELTLGEHVGRFPTWDRVRHGLGASAEDLPL